ncbi:MAG: hypothetical protein ACYTAS_07705 [Planctomycetota bacterium]|jgi:hypothetical protein
MRVLDAEIDLRTNSELLWDRYRPFFLLLIVSAIADAFSTTWFMALLSPGAESNLVVKMLSYTFGIVWGPVLGKVLQIAAVWLLCVATPKLTPFVCSVIIFLNAFAVYINTHFA